MSGKRPASRGRIIKVDLAAFQAEPLHRRIYLSLRRDIVDGVIMPGASLPSSRRLAADLRVSRGTVVTAYEQLRGEGYLDANLGGGTRVAGSVPDLCLRAANEPTQIGSAADARRPSRRGRQIADDWRSVPFEFMQAGPRAFRSTPPAIDIFPIDTWSRIASRQWRRATTRDLSYGQPMGYLPLRRVIADHVRTIRGVRCTVEQVMVVAGTQQAMDISARALLDPGDTAWIEDPAYFGARGALVAAGATIVPVGVDDEGMDVLEGQRLCPNARLAIVTPSHQVPLGVPLSASRRRLLLEWTESANSFIIEDDYNSDFQYATRPLAALQAADNRGRVVYCGTFNKSLFPGLRVGFVVVPEPLIDAFVGTRFFSDVQPPYLEQATLAEFIADGHYERHIRRLRAIYQARRDLLLSELTQCSRWLTPAQYDSGREVAVWLDPALDDVFVAQAAKRADVDVMPLSPWAIAHPLRPSLRLGYSGIDETDIRSGVQRLAAVLQACSARVRTRGWSSPITVAS